MGGKVLEDWGRQVVETVETVETKTQSPHEKQNPRKVVFSSQPSQPPAPLRNHASPEGTGPLPYWQYSADFAKSDAVPYNTVIE